jgi:hypothetical protein
LRFVLVVALLASCDRNDDCKRAVTHLYEVTTSAGGGKPSKEEQRVIDGIVDMTISKCRDEGLDAAARDCILAMKSFEDLQKLGECPGIRAKKPSWVLVPTQPLPP